MSDNCRSLLVLGGARSGKSRYAQMLAEASGRRCVLIATAQAGDAEMAERIGRHRSERGPQWRTLEEPISIVGALRTASDPAHIVVVDCLTLWLANLLLAGDDPEDATRKLCECLPELSSPVILVSNEVGLGVVPEYPLGRAFRDAQGRLNQVMAEACDSVILMAAGLPVQIKPRQAPTIDF